MYGCEETIISKDWFDFFSKFLYEVFSHSCPFIWIAKKSEVHMLFLVIVVPDPLSNVFHVVLT